MNNQDCALALKVSPNTPSAILNGVQTEGGGKHRWCQIKISLKTEKGMSDGHCILMVDG